MQIFQRQPWQAGVPKTVPPGTVLSEDQVKQLSGGEVPKAVKKVSSVEEVKEEAEQVPEELRNAKGIDPNKVEVKEVDQKVIQQAIKEFNETEKALKAQIPSEKDVGVEVKEMEQPSDDQKKPADGKCPFCGWDFSLEAPEEPKEEDYKAYMRAVVHGAPFTKTFELLGGELKLTYRDVSVGEMDRIYAQLSKDVKDGKITDIGEGQAQLVRYKLLAKLHAVATKNERTEYDRLSSVEGSLSEEVIRRFGMWSESLMTVALDYLSKFEALVHLLEVRSGSDFYKTTSGQRSSSEP